MQRLAVLILIIAIVALFIVPESAIGEYKGLLKTKYFLESSVIKAKSIFTALLKGERPEEFDYIESKVKEEFYEGKEIIKEEIKEGVKDSAKDAIDKL